MLVLLIVLGAIVLWEAFRYDRARAKARGRVSHLTISRLGRPGDASYSLNRDALASGAPRQPHGLAPVRDQDFLPPLHARKQFGEVVVGLARADRVHGRTIRM
jgi:hypothetical protein